MRRRPVTRSEIRFNGRYISTLPVDAVRKEDFGRIVPILELWAPLLRSLTQWRRGDDAQWAQFFNAIGIPKKPQTPEPVRLPDRYVWPEPRLCSCQRCGDEFYRLGGSGRYCSDVCAEAGQAVRNAAIAEARAAARADRYCANPDCNKPLTTQRSTMKFCSERCRQAIRNAAIAEARAAARADRYCARCNEPITAQRSTMKFCSERCRAAAHRERKAAEAS
jgi:hypothetical protein